MEEALYMKEADNAIFIRAKGHITSASCAELKARAIERLEAKPPVCRVYIDLSECEYMDSTFLGLLVGLNKRFSRFAERQITLLKPNETCMGLLKTIGIASVVEVSRDEVPFPASMDLVGSSRKATAGLVLDAHEELMGLSDDNKKRFSTLYTILKDQADKQGE